MAEKYLTGDELVRMLISAIAYTEEEGKYRYWRNNR